MKTLKTLITGGFRPPGKQIVGFLPAGAQLTLKPEYDNPYDDGAILVYVEPTQIPRALWAEADAALEGTGFTIEELLVAPEIVGEQNGVCLGYVARTGGRPLAGTNLPGNAEFKLVLDARLPYQCSLAFAPDGKPMVSLVWQESDGGANNAQRD